MLRSASTRYHKAQHDAAPHKRMQPSLYSVCCAPNAGRGSCPASGRAAYGMFGSFSGTAAATVEKALHGSAEVVDFWGMYKGDRWRDHEDGYEMTPGVTVLRIPGHTEEDASLMVETAEGIYVLTPLWWLPDMTPEQDPLAWNRAKLKESRNKIITLADWIIPGHGPMFKNPRKSEHWRGMMCSDESRTA